MKKFPVRTIDDLRKNAELFWSADLAKKELDSSVIPLLLETQSKFISILHVADSAPTV